MFVLGNLFSMLAQLLGWVLRMLELVVLVNALLSWFQPRPSNGFLDLLERISDALCDPLRRLFPTAAGGIDFAPLVVMLVIEFVGMQFLVPTLMGIAARLQ